MKHLLLALLLIASFNSAEAHTCQTKPCVNTQQGSLASQCIEILARNGYSISAGSRAQICADTTRPNGIRALEALAGCGQNIDDSTLVNILNINHPLAVQAVTYMVRYKYNVSAGNRAYLLSLICTKNALNALVQLLDASQNLDDATLAAIVSLR